MSFLLLTPPNASTLPNKWKATAAKQYCEPGNPAQNLCLNLLKMSAVFQQISLKWMFIQNEINLFTFSMTIFPSFLLLPSPFLNSLLGVNPVGFSLLKGTPFKVFSISKLPIPVLIVSPLLFLVSLLRAEFCVPHMIISAVQHRYCQSWSKLDNSHNPVLP